VDAAERCPLVTERLSFPLKDSRAGYRYWVSKP
jgi:hypothetical protein